MLLAVARQSRQLLEQRLGLLQIARIKPFGEPAIDRREKVASCISLTLIAPQPRQAHRGTQLKGPGLLLLRDGDCSKECFLGWRRARRIALEQNFAAQAMQQSVAPVLSCLTGEG